MSPTTKSRKKVSGKKAVSSPAKAEPGARVEALIFDVDNVLIDTRRSYLDTIRWTIEIFLTSGRVPIFKKSSRIKGISILTAEDVEQFKLLGGFNDDWDCCYGLLIYLLSLDVKQRSADSLRRAKNIKKFVRSVYRRPLRVEGIVKKLGRPSFVTIEKISRIFQEVYLGRDLFTKLYRSKPFYWSKKGLISKEKLVFRKSTLKKLKERGIKLGIATGRSNFEAIYTLRQFGIFELFEAITTMDDIRKAEKEDKCSLRKPDPYSIIATAKKLGANLACSYIGDLPDDVIAANAAKKTLDIESVVYAGLAVDQKATRAEIEAVKPDVILEKPSDILLYSQKKRR